MSSQPPKHSSSVRYLVLFAIGLLAGIIATVLLLRSIESRKTWQDHYPEATMHLLEAHMAQLDGTVQANRCGASDLVPHLQALRTLGNDLEPAFADLRDDSRFSGHASAFRAALDASLSSPPLDCSSAKATLAKLGETCSACHRDFH